MAGIFDMLQQQLAGAATAKIANSLGADTANTQNAIGAALPVIIGALARNAQSQDGAASLAKAVEKDHDGSIFDNIGDLIRNPALGTGSGILKHALGGKQNVVQQTVAKAAGLDAQASGKLMEMLAPMVMGALGKAKQQGGLDAAGLAAMLSGERKSIETKEPKAAGMLGGLLDRDGDGDVDLNDLTGGLGNLFR